jgi:putative tryptophan/tyrosine transport system substrate-binding protein
MRIRELCLYIVGGLGILALLFILFFSKPGSFGSPLIGVIIWDKELLPYMENLQGVVDGLLEESYQDGLNLKLQVLNAAAERERAAAAARQLHEAGAQLLITLGTMTTLAALEATQNSRIPVLYSMVENPAAAGLAWPDNPEEIRLTGVSYEVGAEEQLHFLLLAQPNLRRLGILYCDAIPVAESTVAALKATAEGRGLTVALAAIPDDRPEAVHAALLHLINQNIEALFLPHDPILLRPKNVRLISDQATRAYLPVVASCRFCIEQGAFMAYHGDPVELGRQTGRQAARLLAGAPLTSVPPEMPRIKRLTVNLKVAQELGLTLSKDFLSRAYHLFQ